MTLNELKQGEMAIIKKNRARGAVGQRMMAMGFFPGVKVEVVRNAPLVDPVEFLLDGCHVSIRHEEAALLEIEPE